MLRLGGKAKTQKPTLEAEDLGAQPISAMEQNQANLYVTTRHIMIARKKKKRKD